MSSVEWLLAAWGLHFLSISHAHSDPGTSSTTACTTTLSSHAASLQAKQLHYLLSDDDSDVGDVTEGLPDAVTSGN